MGGHQSRVSKIPPFSSGRDLITKISSFRKLAYHLKKSRNSGSCSLLVETNQVPGVDEVWPYSVGDLNDDLQSINLSECEQELSSTTSPKLMTVPGQILTREVMIDPSEEN